MKFLDPFGKQRNLKNAKKYLIDWNAKSRSKFQNNVKNFLKEYWIHDIVFEEFRIVGTRLSIDFYNANRRVAIEVQGDQHIKYVLPLIPLLLLLFLLQWHQGHMNHWQSKSFY